MNLKGTKLLLAGIGAVLFAPGAMAMPILPGGSSDGGMTWTTGIPDADGRQAEAVFTATSSGFIIELSNLALSTSQPNEILVGLIFDFVDGGDPLIMEPSTDGLTNVFAAAIGALGPSLMDFYGVDYGLNLDGEHGFRDDMDVPTGGLGKYGISSSAYDPLELSQVIDSSVAYEPPSSPNGAEFGIAGGDTSGLVSSIRFWAVGSVTIEFETTGDFDYGLLEQVHFLYGTDFEATRVPEPGTLALLGVGLLVMGFSRRRRKIHIRD